MAALEKRERVGLARVIVASVAASAGGFLLACAFFLAALFSHRHVFVTIAVAALAIGLLGTAAARASQTYLLVRLGAWTDLNRRRVTRQEQPVRFVIWLAFNVVYVTIFCAGAVFMIWTTVPPGLHGR